ncbi:MAG: sugar phosphate isomerase/epimerase family protein [Thermodesulfobacteriota bacterium]|nr:sugar phosphate isomerase/epimerase family protein [Thermodesulfobacteriota bacterium]
MTALDNAAILGKVQICIPFRLLEDKYLPLVLKRRINPEIGIDGNLMDTHGRKAFSRMASLLRQEGLSITLHGPFYDLSPGAVDKKILLATRERLRQAFDLIPLFEPASVVCHTGYDRKRYGNDKDLWLETAVETWAPLVKDLEGTRTRLMLENVYEKTPAILLRLIKGLNTKNVGFCFDTGHMHAFSATNVQGWLEDLGPFVEELHVHDNHGSRDDHLAIGAGDIDFDTLFRYVAKNRLKPIITLEAHKEEWIWQSLEALSRSEPFCRVCASL